MLKLWDKQIRDFTGMKIPKLKWPSTPWLYLYGDTGSGKSTLARWWINSWEGWEFTYCVSFVDYLIRANHDGQSWVKLLDRIYTCPRMVIDDLGNEPDHGFTLQRKSSSTFRSTPPELFELIMHRREESKLWTIFTSNLSPFKYADQEEADEQSRRPKIIDWDKSREESGLTEKYGEKTWRRVMSMSTIYHFRGIHDLDQKFSAELKFQGKGKTDIDFFPPLPEEQKIPTAAEMKKATKQLRKDNPQFNAMIEKWLKDGKGKV